jgi:hypothetical protein
MMKDRLIKEKLLNYYLKRFWYPQLEVNILSKQRISNTRKLITDIDVLGLYTDITGFSKIILGDCKTLKNQSPITRTLWMRGLMDYFNCEKGIILLSKEIEKEHQLTASILNIQLLSDDDFEIYSKNTADYNSEIKSALSMMEHWDAFFQIEKRFPPLASFGDFSKTFFWNEQDSNYQLRSGIYFLRKNKGELNPSNPLHQSITLNHFSLIAIALNNILIKVFNQYLVPTVKTDLDTDLKIIIYGGIENYDFLNELRKKFSNPSIGEPDLKLPEWDKFIELVRALLERPLAFSRVSLVLKEISFARLNDKPHQFNYAGIISKSDKYISSFSLHLVEYLCAASGIPSEFLEIFSQYIVENEK